MLAATFAASPLYRLFCLATGYGGTPKIAAAPPPARAVGSGGEKTLTVRLNADVANGLPWAFEPLKPSLVVAAGEQAYAAYRVRNRSPHAIVGRATYNVTPHALARFVTKIECFCFQEQRLGPGEEAELKLAFFIDPALAQDRAAMNAKSLTLSYTFFPVSVESPELESERRERQKAGFAGSSQSGLNQHKTAYRVGHG
jgi:cytochrome c oxidase assembly protein subunit 11